MALVVLCSLLRNDPFIGGSSVPFLGAIGISMPRCSKLTFSCEKRSVPKKNLIKKLEASCKTLTKSEDELDYTVDSLTGDLCSKAKRKAIKVGVEVHVRWCVWAAGTGR